MDRKVDLLDERTLADFAPGGSFRCRQSTSQPEAEQHEKTSRPDAGSDTRNHPGCKIHGERFITALENLQNEVFDVAVLGTLTNQVQKRKNQ